MKTPGKQVTLNTPQKGKQLLCTMEQDDHSKFLFWTLDKELKTPQILQKLNVQKGSITKNGLNGVTIDALLIVAIKILETYQYSKEACDENDLALHSLRAAQGILEHRKFARRLIREINSKIPA